MPPPRTLTKVAKKKKKEEKKEKKDGTYVFSPHTYEGEKRKRGTIKVGGRKCSYYKSICWRGRQKGKKRGSCYASISSSR